MSKDKRAEWTVCGRAIGTATGWDQSDTFAMMLYDFEPAEGCKIPKGVVLFRFENGTVETHNDDGSIALQLDMIDALKDLPISRTD